MSNQLPRICSLVFGLSCLVNAATSASAATYTVINTADSGLGSLRQAVADANGTAVGDDIAFNLPPTDPNCDPNRVCTITLTGGVLSVTAAGGSLTIANQTGAGKLLISGNNANRVVEVGALANLTIDGLTITRGLSTTMAVVYNLRGSLTILNSVLTQNAGGVVILSTAMFGGPATLNVINTTVHNNSSIGIFVANGLSTGGTVSISDSTISNNIPNNPGGGNGAGIYFYGDQMTVTNSTISGNSNLSGGGGGIFAALGPVTLTNCTITNNSANGGGGGGIQIYQSSVKLRNSIVAGNTDPVGPDLYYGSSGNTVSLGNNLIGNHTNLGTPHMTWVESDLLSVSAGLAPLGNYGGPTQTHALMPNSLAINAGANCVLTANGCGDGNPAVPTDQRGAVRVPTVDIGAFERGTRSGFDYDGDGKSDISVFRPSDGTWYLLQSQDGFRGFPFGVAADKIVPADYDGDGKTDVAVYRPSTGYWYVIKSLNGTLYYFPFGIAEDLPIPADYDGDGRADLAVFRPSTATFYRVNSSNGGEVSQQFGAVGDKPAVGDFDGDGKADVSVYRPSSGSWYRINSSNGTFFGTQFGLATDLITPGDFDGDGKSDLGVFRPSTGAWYRLNSGNGAFVAIQFGVNGDIPTPSDYDLDFKDDISVFRPSDNTWYRLNSSNGAFFAQQFGSNGDRPTPAAFRY